MFLFSIFFCIIFLPITIMLPTKVVGKVRKNKDKGVIIVANHYSNYDAMLLDVKLKKRIRFLGKKELVKTKITKWFFEKVAGVVSIDRGSADIKATKQILQLLKENKTIGVFPEGTRNKNEEDKFEAKNGVCMFAIKSKTPIVPVWLVKKPKLFRRNILLVGELFELSEFYNERLSQEVLNKASAVLTEKMLELKKAYEQQVLEKQIVKEMKKNKK